MSELPAAGATAVIPSPKSVRVAHGRGRLHDQPASFLIAAGGDDRAIWVAVTADGRTETAIVEPEGATARSWSIGALHTLELEDLERQVAIVRALTDSGLAGRTIELPSAAGMRRLTLGPSHEFADKLALPVTATMQLEGQLEWELTIERAGAATWDSVRQLAESAGRSAVVVWTESGEVPIESRIVPASGHLLVRLSLNGADGWFLLDTGATELVVLPAFAHRAALRSIGSRLVTSMAGVERAAQVDVGDITVGPLTISGTAGVVSTALETLPTMLDTPLDGIIGAHLFSYAVVRVDHTAGTVTIAPAAPADTAWTPVHFQSLHPLVEGIFEGRRALFRLDTGAVPGVLFNATAVRAHSLLEGRPTVEVPADGVLELRLGTLTSFEIAGVMLQDVDALFSTSQRTMLSDSVTAGLVGIPVLRRFTLMVDLPGRRIALEPRG